MQHARTLRLKRRKGLKAFDHLKDWRSITISEWEPSSPGRDAGSAEPGAESMSNGEWDTLTEDARLQLYGNYERNHLAAREHACRLVSSLCFLINGGGEASERVDPQTAQNEPVLKTSSGFAEVLREELSRRINPALYVIKVCRIEARASVWRVQMPAISGWRVLKRSGLS
ncbi:hypothetical protein H2203_005184 [Taxawa tesnikishii (nom. ined.)]|nr:hypothetical protein H2203_005184 [Dothideales sp. JES 119]